MGVKFANNAYGTLNASITSSDTSLTLSSGQGARFPSLGAGDYFYVTLIDTSNNLEIAKCTARSSDVLTITRGQEGTTSRAYSVGDRVELRITSAALGDIYSEAVADSASSLDGDRGDITVSSNGTVWSLDANVVGANELNVSGNGTAGQALLSDGDGTMSWGRGTDVLQRTNYNLTSRFSLPSQSSEYTWWSVTYNRLSATSTLYIESTIPADQLVNGPWAGFAININGYKTARGMKHVRPGSDTTILGFQLAVTAAEIGSTTGNITIGHLQAWGNASAAIQIANRINFNGSDDGRISSSLSTAGFMSVTEVEP